MAKTDYKSVNDYIAAQPKAVQGILQEVRGVIRKALPKAQEVISYQIPAYKVDGAAVVYFSGWKEHYSLYPATKGLVAALKKELAAYEVEKATMRFPLDRPVPKTLIAAIARKRAEEVAAELAKKAKAKKAATKKAKR
ncbi:iron chaperone [Taklimakanibacter deserti]|uniref:iron chaperone n=1 Tax=Taklimakanibacter deserti TaxID=2267839 RepID=UPI000E65CB89